MSMLNKSSYVILGLLSKSDYSGYSLKRFIAKTSAFYWSESNAQIYPVLKKLEQQGLVTSHLDKASGARNKRIYSISKPGREELMAWLENDCPLDIYREEFLLQLSLGQHLPKPTLRKKLIYYRGSVVDKLTQLNLIIKHIKTKHAGKTDQRFLMLTYDHIKTVLDAKLRWCDKVMKDLNI